MLGGTFVIGHEILHLHVARAVSGDVVNDDGEIGVAVMAVLVGVNAFFL